VSDGAAAVLLGTDTTALAPDPLIPTVFHQPWWLDIVTDRQWTDVEVKEDTRVVGRLPIFLTHRLGMPFIGMPPLTHFLGPAVDSGRGGKSTQWLKQVAITRELIRQSPKAVRNWQKLHRGVTDIVPFQAEYFQNQVQFTFEIIPAQEDVLWGAMRDKTRNVIRKARRRLVTQELTDVEEFVQFYQANLQRHGRSDWNGRHRMAALITACLERGAGTILAGRDKTGALMAAVFCPRDHAVAYYLLSTRHPDSENGAVAMLVWDALREAAGRGLTFDFDGLPNERTIGLYAGFGGVARPRYIVYSTVPSRAMRLVRRGMRLNSGTFGS
jgi:hypothetical protein